MTERAPSSFGSPRRLGLRTLAVQPHEALDAMQAAGQPFGQDVVPDAAARRRSGRFPGSSCDLRRQPLVHERMGAERPGQPGMEARSRHIERLAKPAHRPDVAVLRDEGEPHRASLAK